MNRLSSAKSAYLRHAANQKIDWFQWSDEPFEKARQQDKPVFLSSGAVWCHWCHVMAKECFENNDIISLLNNNFISIKLDRDERPDIDRRYQQAVHAMGSNGGWPLSVFLSHDRKPFFGGTYFPPDDAFGRPGFIKVLRVISDFYKSNRDKVAEYSEKLMTVIKSEATSHGEIDKSLINKASNNILSAFDHNNGGFGSFPKFSMPGATEFLINNYYFSGDKEIGYAIRKTLFSMAKGGIHDQIGGGFHRYSTDEAWIMPHFEKMADDNAWLLRNYADAYCVFGDEYFRITANGIIRFAMDVLSDTEGGFYTSQDADVTPDDEGGYFTWTDEDFRSALSEEEYRIMSLHLLHEKGSVHHNPSKKVLFVVMEPDEIAKKIDMDTGAVENFIRTGKEKLLRARNNRPAPFIDKAFYTSINSMMATSFIKASRILKDDYIREFALKSIDRIMSMHLKENKLLHTYGVKAMFDDYIYLIEAQTSAYEATSDKSRLSVADNLMELCISRFWDNDKGGFFDTDEEVLGIRLKSIEDIPHPSPNSIGTLLLLKLYHLTDKNTYLKYAERALSAFAGRTGNGEIHHGYYYASVEAYFNLLRLSLYTPYDGDLASAVLSSCRPYVNITYNDDRGYVLPCLMAECYDPLYDLKDLKFFLEGRQPK